ncbi:MAG: helix-turn-helix domain-containing protein [Winogradskyella sp.]|uniref:helix-turn-helix domain-containing protein n=1 Tax=Winogradskyella sp. TaxID=1883156 RepID=UPI00345AC81E|nr:helix-turn-helix domain-containing protein [Winogradskyella sp.]
MSLFKYTKKLDLIISLLFKLIKSIDSKHSDLNVTKSVKKDVFITSKEACEILKCSSVKLWELRRSGVLKTYHFGKNIRLKKSEVYHLIQNKL